MTNGCDNEAVVGAHVRAYKGRTVFIIGLCRTCNHYSNDTHFEVDERSVWVEPVYQPGCGILSYLKPGDKVVKSPTAAEVFVLLNKLGEDVETTRWNALSLSREKQMHITLSASGARFWRPTRED